LGPIEKSPQGARIERLRSGKGGVAANKTTSSAPPQNQAIFPQQQISLIAACCCVLLRSSHKMEKPYISYVSGDSVRRNRGVCVAAVGQSDPQKKRLGDSFRFYASCAAIPQQQEEVIAAEFSLEILLFRSKRSKRSNKMSKVCKFFLYTPPLFFYI
jgi:hypothetical protein